MKKLMPLVLIVAALAACGPVAFPSGKESYVGTWAVDDGNLEGVTLDIAADGYVDEQTVGGGAQSSDLSGPISEWKGDNFVVFFHEFQVSKLPREIPSTCTDSVIDCPFDDTCGDDHACHDKAGAVVDFAQITVDGRTLTKHGPIAK